MPSRKKARKIDTPSPAELQALSGALQNGPPIEKEVPVNDEQALVFYWNTIVDGLGILYDTASTGSETAKRFFVNEAKGRADEDLDELNDRFILVLESVWGDTKRNSPSSRGELRTMAERFVQDVGALSEEYPGYVAENWK